MLKKKMEKTLFLVPPASVCGRTFTGFVIIIVIATRCKITHWNSQRV